MTDKCERCGGDFLPDRNGRPRIYAGRPRCILTGEEPRALTEEEMDAMLVLRGQIAAASGADLFDVPTVRFRMICGLCAGDDKRAQDAQDEEARAQDEADE